MVGAFCDPARNQLNGRRHAVEADTHSGASQPFLREGAMHPRPGKCADGDSEYRVLKMGL